MATQEVYGTSKAGFTHLLGHLAAEVDVESCQMISYHPGRIFTEGATDAGFKMETLPVWDDGKLKNSSANAGISDLTENSLVASDLGGLGGHPSGVLPPWKVRLGPLGRGRVDRDEGQV